MFIFGVANCEALDKITIKLNPKFYSSGELVIEAKRNTASDYLIESIQLDQKAFNWSEAVGSEREVRERKVIFARIDNFYKNYLL